VSDARHRRGRHLLERGGRSTIPVGAHLVVPEGPDWPWRVGAEAFDRQFARMAEAGLDTVRIDLLWAAVEPEPGRYDEAHLAVLDQVLEAARRHGLSLHPTLFVGGEVGDATWDVPWRDGRNPHADPELRRLQRAQAAALARRWAGDAAVIAWDLSDEPPFWLCPDTEDADAEAWTRELAEAIRDADPSALVTVGTASQDIYHGPFRADVVAPHLDFACVHPYPIYSPELYPDGLLAPRMTHAAAFETALAAGVGKPVMVHEFGASSAQFDPDRIGAYDRLLVWSSLGRGAAGFYAWCWTDAEPPAYGRAPYVRQPHETQFGLTDWRGGVRPRGRVLSELARTLAQIDLDDHAALGPAPRAAVVVPHEFARPYDEAAYGLDDAPAGPYRPTEAVWQPERDVKPVVRAWLESFVLAARAGFSLRFERERLDDVWPEARLMLVPAPLTTSATSLVHVRTSFWRGAHAFLQGGGTLYLSCSADSAIPEMDELAGVRLADRAAPDDEVVVRLQTALGRLAKGDELRLPSVPRDLSLRGAQLRLSDAEPLALDGRGEPVLTLARRGRGQVITSALPLELLHARLVDAHGEEDGWWKLYAALADLAGAREGAWADDPAVTTGTVYGRAGALAAVTNHSGAEVSTPLRLPEGVAQATVWRDAEAGELADARISLPPFGSAIVTWRSP
jgi:endo-1,4-beta-mannosidase